MYILYSSLFYFVVVLFLPIWLPLCLIHPRLRFGLGQRLGMLPPLARKVCWVSEGGVIWLHAASLGEVNALAPVARELANQLPKESFVFTCTTQAGVNQAALVFPQALAHLVLPLDLPLFLAPFLRAFPPKLALIAETELWPNFLRMLKDRRCLILVANGRMTERSFRRYRALEGLFGQALRRVDAFAMQGEEEARRVRELGAHPHKVTVAGNTKFDAGTGVEAARGQQAALRRELRLESGAPLLVVGSTRDGEEAVILRVFEGLARRHPGLVMVLAPRHLKRLGEVMRLVEKSGLPSATRSSLAQGRGEGARVILLDTFGELAAVYGLADVAVVGGSFLDFGGQNPLEPAALGVPVVFGPHMGNFAEIRAGLLEAGAAVQVADEEELGRTLSALLKDPARRHSMGKAGRKLVAEKSGAASRVAALACKLHTIRNFRQENLDWRDKSAYQSTRVVEFGAGMAGRGKQKRSRGS